MVERDRKANQESTKIYWDRLLQGDQFRRVVAGHLDMELFGKVAHLAESAGYPQVLEHGTSLPGNAYFTRVFQPRPPAALLQARQQFPLRVVPVRGYWVPIFGDMQLAAPLTLSDLELTEASRRVADLIETELAREGILPTLFAAMNILGPEKFIDEPQLALRELRDLGFPIDWLSGFAMDWKAEKNPRLAMIKDWATKLQEGRALAEWQAQVKTLPFQFTKSHPDFQVGPESGSVAIGAIRMQMGGGYHDGIIPGGSIDLIAQMVRLLPEADFLVHIPSELVENVKWMARRYWPLQRTNQLTLLAEPLPVAAWAQDNGKAGLMAVGAVNKELRHATLIPRYASQEEAPSQFIPNESFLMANLAGMGHRVVQSPLLFQGGNLLAVMDPQTDRRILLIGEAEVNRNQAMGLSLDQVLQSFRVEFGVDECVSMPAASFHIDYDMTLREHDGRLLAFVNDSMAAVRIIVERGLETLLTHELMSRADVASARKDLASERYGELFQTLSRVIYPHAAANGVYPESFQNMFAVHPVDSSTHNMRCFLVALDILASRGLAAEEWQSFPDFYRDYLASLRLVESQTQRQWEVLKGLGIEIVRVPSLPDVPAGLNYLNGLQDKDRYFMPAQGGFYQALDAAATGAFEQALGSSFEVIPVISGECQRAHGAVHCAAAAYPELGLKRDDS